MKESKEEYIKKSAAIGFDEVDTDKDGVIRKEDVMNFLKIVTRDQKIIRLHLILIQEKHYQKVKK